MEPVSRIVFGKGNQEGGGRALPCWKLAHDGCPPGYRAGVMFRWESRNTWHQRGGISLFDSEPKELGITVEHWRMRNDGMGCPHHERWQVRFVSASYSWNVV